MLIGRPVAGAAGLLAAALVAGGLSACGSSDVRPLDRTKVEQAIAGSILHDHHTYSLVGCPDRLPDAVGSHFTCTAQFTVGTYPVEVSVHAGGRISYASHRPLVILDTARVQAAIASAIRSQRHLLASVTCPTPVLQSAGLKFRCTARIHGQVTPFEVTQTDANGHVSFVGV